MAELTETARLRQEISDLHQDCRDLANFITAARSEIAEMRPNDLKQDKLPRVGKELDAIVEATENATNQIMTATESIMSAKVTEPDVVNDACLQIFEACSFQDITGQRISKVVATLEYIEQHLARLTKAWGHKSDQTGSAEISDQETDEEAQLLNGPALAGEGINQQFIDTIFDESATIAPKSKTSPAPETPKSEQLSAQEEIDALFD
ncbi:protein phosphatase CheZ [Sneathiella sp.]|uniref:protein phosphatase CheZ n=1 Tax=Sneathiella sp. TaxID=1964365 RepID=UPI003561C4CB